MLGFIEKGIKKNREEDATWYVTQLASIPVPEEICVVPDIPYLDDGSEHHKMDIYYPQCHEGKLPVVFDFHGGGLISCDRKFNRAFCSEIAKRGFLVFCIDYPHVPENDVYTILQDAYEGVRAGYRLLEEYDGDRNRLFLCGDSSAALSTHI